MFGGSSIYGGIQSKWLVKLSTCQLTLKSIPFRRVHEERTNLVQKNKLQAVKVSPAHLRWFVARKSWGGLKSSSFSASRTASSQYDVPILSRAYKLYVMLITSPAWTVVMSGFSCAAMSHSRLASAKNL
jgi:hypothetical protein